MAQAIQSVLVIGLGKVGKLVATLLFENGYRTTGLDAGSQTGLPFQTIKGRVESKAVLKKAIKDHDAVVTCLPYDLNLAVAAETHRAGKHYFDLTEDVPTTAAIKKLSKTSKGVMAPQCGLAPGFICIVGADLAGKFRHLRSIELRVGALPQKYLAAKGRYYILSKDINASFALGWYGGSSSDLPFIQYVHRKGFFLHFP